MGLILLYIFLTLIVLACVSLLKTFKHISPKEIKRRSQQHDHYAEILYKVTSYGLSANTVLWFLVIVASTALYVVLSSTLTWYFAAPYIAVVIWFGFVWLPAGRVGTLGTRLAKILSPMIAKLLSWIHPYVDKIVGYFQKLRPITLHTGLYEKEDLLDLLDIQKNQLDNRITADEITVAKGALTYADKIVRDCMTPRSMVVMAHADDSVGPVLFDELHKSGHSRFPVFGEHPDEVVGTLYLRDTVESKKLQSVKDVMSGAVFYIHEEQSLLEALKAFLKTKHHLFLVTNSFEELVGIITIEDVLEQIIGKQIVDEFDKYEDIRAVAMSKAEKVAKNREHVTISTDENKTTQ